MGNANSGQWYSRWREAGKTFDLGPSELRYGCAAQVMATGNAARTLVCRGH